MRGRTGRTGRTGASRRVTGIAAAALLALGAAPAAGAPPGGRRPVPPDEFPLFATPGHAPASGTVRLRQTWSPFGVSVAPDGTVTYEVTIETRDLPAAAPGEAYVAWITSPDLARIRRVGTLGPDGSLRDAQAGAAFLVIISREPMGAPCVPGTAGDASGGTAAARWRGPIVLRGSSPGSRIGPLFGHSIFQPSPM